MQVGVWSVVTNMTPHEDKREKRIHNEENLTIMQVVQVQVFMFMELEHSECHVIFQYLIERRKIIRRKSGIQFVLEGNLWSWGRTPSLFSDFFIFKVQPVFIL